MGMIINLFPVGTIVPHTPENLGVWEVTVTYSGTNIQAYFTPYSQYVSSGVNWGITISLSGVSSLTNTPGDTVSYREYGYYYGATSGMTLHFTVTRADGTYTEDYDYTVP